MSQTAYSRLSSRAAVLVAARVLAAVATLVTQIILARYMASADLGHYFFAVSLAATLSVLAALGFPNVSNRFLSRYRLRGRQSRARDFVVYSGANVLTASVIVACAVMALAALSTEGSTATAIIVAMIAVPLMAVSLLVGSVLNAERQFLWASLPELLFRPWILLGVLFGLVSFGITPSAFSLLLVLIASYALILSVQLHRAVGLFPNLRSHRASRGTEKRVWLTAAWPLIAMSLFTNLYADLAIVVAGLSLIPSQLALLAIALKLSMLVGFFVQTIHQMVLPDLTDAVTQRDADAVNEQLRKARWLTVPISLAALVGVIVWGQSVLLLFGESYVAAHLLLLVFVATQVFRAMLGPSIQLLVSAGRQRSVMAITYGSIPVIVIASLAGASMGGALGTAMGLSIGYSFWCLMGWLQARALVRSWTSTSSSTTITTDPPSPARRLMHLFRDIFTHPRLAFAQRLRGDSA